MVKRPFGNRCSRKALLPSVAIAFGMTRTQGGPGLNAVAIFFSIFLVWESGEVGTLVTGKLVENDYFYRRLCHFSCQCGPCSRPMVSAQRQDAAYGSG